MMNTTSAGTVADLRAVELVSCCLRKHPYSSLRRVSCQFVEGTLVLRGLVPTFYLKQIAQETVAKLVGVDLIQNEIQVVGETESSGN